MTQQWPVSLYAAEEEDQMAKCACAAPPPTAHPHQNKPLAKKKEKKSYSQHVYAPINGHKEQKTTGGAPNKGAARPGPSLLFCAEEWRGPGAAAAGCMGHLSRSFSPKNKVWRCEWTGCTAGGVEKRRREAVYKTKGTLCQIDVELTPH